MPKTAKYLGVNQDPLKIITINVSKIQLQMIKILVANGFCSSRSELMRMMLSEWLPVKIQEYRELRGLVKDNTGIDMGISPKEEDIVRVPQGDGTYRNYRKAGNRLRRINE